MKSFIQDALGYAYNPFTVNILLLQGITLKNNMPILNNNEIDKYNDSLIICLPNGTLAWYDCTTDPGRYYTTKPMNDRGCAHIAYGQHLYTTGLHRGKPALRAFNEKIWLWFDRNKNNELDPDETIEECFGSGVNIHWGGMNPESVGEWSAGCVAVLGGYEGPFKSMMRQINGNKPPFLTTLWRGSDYMRWVENPNGFIPTLRLGTIGGKVYQLQQRINEVSPIAKLMADGIFGAVTLKAVKAIQLRNNLVIDGIVGARTWGVLNG